MRKKLLFTTTALVAVFSATAAWSTDRKVIQGSADPISGTFENSSIKGENGGAIYNSKGKVVSIDGKFNSNSAKDGGAIYNGNKGEIESLTGEFSLNQATGRGGAIYSSGSSSIGKISGTFTQNSAGTTGGAISNAGTQQEGYVNIENSTFKNNTAATGGGAIHNMSSAKMKITGSFFTENDANVGGNDFGGGAIYNRGKIEVADTTFDGNEAQRGGAVHNVGDKGNSADATFTNVDFNNNHAKIDGGAIFNGNYSIIDELTGTFTGNSVVHDEQKNNHRGGAIYNTGSSKINSLSATFTNNTADKGGAISNAGTMTIKDSTFTNNTAGFSGGAIHNKGELTLSGNNIFSGNKAQDNLNDISNSGTINVTSGSHLTLDGGISKNYTSGTINFADNSHLTVKVNTTEIDNNVNIGKDAKLDLVFANGYQETVYDMIVDGNEVTGEFTLTNEDNGLYKITRDTEDAHKFTVEKKSTSEIATSTGANTNQASTITAITAGTSENDTFNAIADAISTKLQSSDKNDVKAAIDATTALAPEVAPMVQKTQTETANQVFGAVSTRLTGGSVSTGGEGMSSGDNIFERAAMWVQGLFNHSKLDDTSKAYGFDADSSGVAMGAEKYVTEDTKIGLGYAYTNTDIDGFMRSTDVDTHTAFVYGEYKPSNWYVNGIMSYGWSDYEESKNVSGIGVKADYDAETFGLQAMTGYDMQVKGFGLTPEVGLRYVHISQDGYTDSADQKVSGNDSDILTGVIGAKVSKTWTLKNGMNIKPEARIAATYDLMNDDVNSVVTLANGSAYAVEGDALDRFGMEFGAGVTTEVNDNVEFALGYEGKFREDYQDHTGLVNLKYKF